MSHFVGFLLVLASATMVSALVFTMKCRRQNTDVPESVTAMLGGGTVLTSLLGIIGGLILFAGG